jgi:hypothetical protein
VDLAVGAEELGHVTTEHEKSAHLTANKPEGRAIADREDEGIHRPDLVVRIGSVTWIVDVERTAKRRDAEGLSRYTRLAQLVGAGQASLGAPLEFGGWWYLAQSNAHDATVVSAILRGLFEGIASLDRDLLLVVQPWDINELARCDAADRHKEIQAIVSAARPVLGALSDMDAWRPAPAMGSSFLMPSTFERSLPRLDELAVAVVGQLIEPVTDGRTTVQAGARTIPLAGLPGDLAYPVTAGERLVVVGVLDGRGHLNAIRGRGAGGDWEGRPQPDDDDIFSDFDDDFF